MGSKDLFDKLMSSLIKALPQLIAVAVVDREGLIIASRFSGEDQNDETMGSVTAMLENFISRVKTDFGTTESFTNVLTVDKKKFVFASAGSDAILTILASENTTDNALKVYAHHIAQKVEIVMQGNEVDTDIPFMVEVLANMSSGQLPKGNFNTKIIVLGDPQVGKSSLIRRFVDNKFVENYISTIGVDITKKAYILNESCKIDFVIWDIGGQIQHMAPHRKRFYGGANFALLEFDICKKASFENLDAWLADLRTSVDKAIPMVIVANKTDLPAAQHEVTIEEIKKKAETLGCHWIFTSAKTGINVEEAFRYCAVKFLQTF
jgi:small GTP-binding protein